MTAEDESLRILFVCTANICRSPSAEAIARHRHGEHGQLFRSAGFLDGGRQCPSLLLEALGEIGIDAQQHRSYQIDTASLEAADVVLTMEGEHVQKATMLEKSSYPKIMPLREAAAAMDQMGRGPVMVDQLLDAVGRSREPSSYLSPKWDVDDPYNKKLKHYRRAVSEIAGLVDQVVGRLR